MRLLLLPLVLISFNTVLATLVTAGTIEEGTAWAESLMLLGDTTVAGVQLTQMDFSGSGDGDKQGDGPHT